MSSRIALTTSFTGNIKHLKRAIKALLKQEGVGHILQTTITGDTKVTLLFMEQESSLLYRVQGQLISYLHQHFPGIIISEWQEMVSDGPIYDSHIAPTIGSLSKSSSRYVEALEENTLITQQQQSRWPDYFTSGFIQVVQAIQNGRQVAYELQSSVESLKSKSVYVKYKNEGVVFDIFGCFALEIFYEKLKGELNIGDKQINRVYIKKNGSEYNIRHTDSVKEGDEIYVETVDQVVSNAALKFTTLEDFYKALSDVERLEDDEIQIIKTALETQKIKVKHLPGLTNEDLKEYGILQGGLRKSILALLEKVFY